MSGRSDAQVAEVLMNVSPKKRLARRIFKVFAVLAMLGGSRGRSVVGVALAGA